MTLSVESLSARVGSFHLDDVSFSLDNGHYGILIGAAGAGKTTLLEAIAGVIPIRSGHVRVGGRDVTRLPPESRGLGIVYQHGYLFPHLSVERNIRYGALSHAAADAAVDRFGIASLAKRDVQTLSGGERQLVALVRALAREPQVLLLDEPFAALDQRSRQAARRALRALHAERKLTILHVTHDLAEVGLLGDLAIVLNHGRVAQVASPDVVFSKPSSADVAEFIGAENVIRGEAVPDTAERMPSSGLASVQFVGGGLAIHAVSDVPPGPAHAVIRSQDVLLSREPSSSSARNQFPGVVAEIERDGVVARVSVRVGTTTIVSLVTSSSLDDLSLEVGSAVTLAFKATAVHLC